MKHLFLIAWNVIWVILVSLLVAKADVSTTITVTNNWIQNVYVKIRGAGVGGCNVELAPGESTSAKDCWCLWGTVDYDFCVYHNSTITPSELPEKSSFLRQSSCPTVKGRDLLCGDTKTLGNCYDKSYDCMITLTGSCDCTANK